MEISSMDVSWDIEAPRREARLSLASPTAEPFELITLKSPSLPWASTIRDPSLLDAAGSGRILFKIEVSDDLEPSGALPWRINHLRLSVKGKILPPYALTKIPSGSM
jgi:hypothetical protein